MPEESLRKSSLWMISGQGVAMAAQAVYFVLIGRALGSHEYGAFVGVAALIGALSQFSSLGMEMILVRNVSRNRASFAHTWGHALAITMAGFVLLFLAAMLYARFALRPELRVLVPWIALADGLLGKLIQLAARAFQGAGSLAWTARLTAFTNIARAATAALVLAWTHAHHIHATALLWTRVYWLSTLPVALFALAVITLRLGLPRFSRIRRRDLSEGLSFSLSSSSISVYNDIDKTFLVSLGQTSAAGIYSAAYRVVDAASAPIYAVYAAAAPRFFREGAVAFVSLTTSRAEPSPARCRIPSPQLHLSRSPRPCCLFSSARRFTNPWRHCAGSACSPFCARSTTPGDRRSPPPPRSGTAPPPNSEEPLSICA